MTEQHTWMANLARPTVTTMYGLTPAGLGTGQVQSLFDYICLVAFEHRLTATLLIHQLLQAVGREGRQLAARHLNGRDCHGGTLLAQTVVDGMSILTGRTDLSALTLLPLQDFIAGVGLLASERRHCAKCFAPSSGGVIPHGRLLWRLSDVEACPVHKILLVPSVCGAPKSKALIHDQRVVLDGVCSVCGSLGRHCTGTTSEKSSAEQTWRARQVEELITRQEEVGVAGLAAFKAAFSSYCESHDGIQGVSQRSGVGYTNIRFWLTKPAARMSLDAFLRIAAAEGLTLTDLMLGRFDHRSRRRAVPPAERRHYVIRNASTDIEDLARQAAAKGSTVREFVTKHHMSDTTFRRKFPELAAALAKNSVTRNSRLRDERHQERLREVEEVAGKALSQGKPLTLRVAEAITSTRWNPAAPRSQVFIAVRCSLHRQHYFEKHPWSASLRTGVQQLAKRLLDKYGDSFTHTTFYPPRTAR